jgi:hypothetical protein
MNADESVSTPRRYSIVRQSYRLADDLYEGLSRHQPGITEQLQIPKDYEEGVRPSGLMQKEIVQSGQV